MTQICLAFVIPFFICGIFLDFALACSASRFTGSTFFVYLVFLPCVFLLGSPG